MKRKPGFKRVRAPEKDHSNSEEKKSTRQIVLYKRDGEDAQYEWGVVECETDQDGGLKLTNGISISKKEIQKTLSLNFQKAVAGYIEGEKDFRPSRFISTHTVKLVSCICTHTNTGSHMSTEWKSRYLPCVGKAGFTGGRVKLSHIL